MQQHYLVGHLVLRLELVLARPGLPVLHLVRLVLHLVRLELHLVRLELHPGLPEVGFAGAGWSGCWSRPSDFLQPM